MADEYRSVTHRSFGDNLIDSIKGIVAGVIMFLVSFPVLWWNEGRYDISQAAKQAVVVKPDGAGDTGEGKLVAVTDKLTLPAGESVGDPDYLKPAPHVSLRREVEMFAWVETKKTKTEKKLGGGSDTTTTYSYEKKWTSHPQDSSDFKVVAGHENPSLTIDEKTFYASKAQVGAFNFTPDEIELPSRTPIDIRENDLIGHNGRLNGRYIFSGEGTLDAPHVGDTRISFAAVDAGHTATLYGKREGTTVSAYMVPKENAKLYRVLWGTHEEAVATMHGEHTTSVWIIRLVGFLLMWFGMSLVFGPINAILDVVPFIGSAGRALTGIALFPIALVLSGVTIMISIVAHNPILLGATIIGFVAGAAYLVKRSRDKKAAATAKAA
jgi:hypothetical protein